MKGPLRASGGTPHQPALARQAVRSSPRERRYPGDAGGLDAVADVLSARAEVPRPGTGLAGGSCCPLRASGGTPPPAWDRVISVLSSPRERRYPDDEDRALALLAVLSARAEVPRRRRSSAPWARCPLRASGGTPTIRYTADIVVTSSPRERRYPDLRRGPLGGGPVLSARAEVPRCRGGSAWGCRCPLRASGGTPQAAAAEQAPAVSSPRERRYPAEKAGDYRQAAVLSARAEVPRVDDLHPAVLPRPLRASGGTPLPWARRHGVAPSSPRERRYPAASPPSAPTSSVLSARAEVPRRSASSRTPPASPLRASGGTPASAARPVATGMSSPRERRYPGPGPPIRVDRLVLSARAEVPRDCPMSSACMSCPLRASGGTPPCLGGRQDAPRSSPRERRYPVSNHRTPTPDAVLSARAEVPRPHARPGPSRACPLRASGGTPLGGVGRVGRPQSSPRERRYPAGRAQPLPAGPVLSARAEVPRFSSSAPGRLTCPLRASGGTPTARSRTMVA